MGEETFQEIVVEVLLEYLATSRPLGREFEAVWDANIDALYTDGGV